jgi:hypothetical protein
MKANCHFFNACVNEVGIPLVRKSNLYAPCMMLTTCWNITISAPSVEQVAEPVTFVICVREVPTSNLGQNTHCEDDH